tara:strand:+ start:1866 stop:2744 length:879 start_codon:yes stop_codon:yes gene_type:complete
LLFAELKDDTMKLTLHIGMPRAGSIAIEEYLYSLGKAVSPIVSKSGHSELLMLGGTPAASREYSRRFGPITPEKVSALKDALRSSETEHVVLSSKMLYDSSEAEFIGNLCLELDDIFDEARVIIYLRHQVDHFPHLITQRVKAGMKDWDQISAIPDKLYQYDRICALWDQDINVTVRDYGRCRNDVVGDFCRVAGLPAPATKIPKRSHPTMDVTALHLMMRVNACADPAQDHLRRRVVSELERLKLSDQPYTTSPELAAEILERFDAGNQRVSNEYLNGVPLSREAELEDIE